MKKGASVEKNFGLLKICWHRYKKIKMVLQDNINLLLSYKVVKLMGFKNNKLA